MLRTVKIYGTLAVDTGVNELSLDVDNSALLISGLGCNIPDFRKIAANYNKLAVIATKEEKGSTLLVPSYDLLEPFGDATTIHVLPETEGDIELAAAALIAWGVGTVAAYAIVIVGAMAVMYGLSKLSQSMAAKPTTGQSDTSFIFSGPVNSSKQGGAIPIIYGTCLVGSTVIASNYQTIDVPVGTVANTYIPGAGGGGR